MSQQPDPRPRRRARGLKVGSIGGVEVRVQASWLLFALLIAVLLAPSVDRVQPGLGALKYLAGVAFAVLLYLSILLHEVSHALMARRFGLPVGSISLQFIGGQTELGSEPKTARQEFWIAVVGPLTSIVVGLATLGIAKVLPPGLLHLVVDGLAAANIVIGVLNLLPGLPLDGGRVLRAATWQVSRNPHTATVVAAWGGRAIAGIVLLLPLIAYVGWGIVPTLYHYAMAFFFGGYLWLTATASLTNARLRARLPGLVARSLARRAAVVDADMTVAEAVARAQSIGAGGIVVTDPMGRPTGIVSEVALLAVPAERRPAMLIGALTRGLEPGMSLSVDLVGEELVRAMGTFPASEYLLVDDSGRLYGLLATADVDAAFEAGKGTR